MALVITRLDYCNSVLAALPSSTLHLLQQIQNTTARLVFELRHHDHITPALIQVHWLPIRWRIHYKLCTLMHSVHTRRCPRSLSGRHRLADITPTNQKRTAIGRLHELHYTTSTYQIWGACVFLCMTSSLEFFTCRSTSNSRDCNVQEKTENALF